MSAEPPPDPEAVERALAYLREFGARYTRESLEASLREQGFAEPEIAEALRRHAAEQQPVPGTVRDLRPRAAAILLVAFVVTWAALAIPMLTMQVEGWLDLRGPATTILSFLLGSVLLLSLAGVWMSDRLERGVEGALVSVLAVPFVLLFVVAGLCVATVNPFGG